MENQHAFLGILISGYPRRLTTGCSLADTAPTMIKGFRTQQANIGLWHLSKVATEQDLRWIV